MCEISAYQQRPPPFSVCSEEEKTRNIVRCVWKAAFERGGGEVIARGRGGGF